MSEIRANTVSNAAGTGPVTLTGQYAAKAWAFFNGVTASIDQSGNISSLTDNGVGDYTLTMTNALTDATFCTPAGNSTKSGIARNIAGGAKPITSSTLDYYLEDSDGNAVDSTSLSVAAIR